MDPTTFRILFYVSGHGFGHATRVTALVNELFAVSAGIRIHIRTGVPRWLFDANIAGPFEYSESKIDIGMVERDLFSQDVAATLARWEELLGRKDECVSSEADFVRRQGFDLIVSDIPPFASNIGRTAGVPVVAVGNFSWDFIYQPYVRRHPGFQPIVDDIRASYERTELLLRLPFSHVMSAFPRQVDIPLLTRRALGDGDATRLELGIARGDPRPIVLLAIRTEGLTARGATWSARFRDVILVSFAPLVDAQAQGITSIHIGREWQHRFVDLLRASDVAIAKLGYGIVSECIAARTPLLYPPRFDFSEFDLLVEGVTGVLPSRMIPLDEFVAGDWQSYVDEAVVSKRASWCDVPLDGAATAARAILGAVRW